MIEVCYQDRLGNNLFQYCMGRILAEELGFGLKCDPLPGFPNTAETVTGYVCEWPLEVFTGHSLPFLSILTNFEPRHIVLAGWFQRAEYYKPYRDRIRIWLELLPEHKGVSHELVIHVRRTDYISNGWALPFSYYQKAIELVYEPGMVVNIATDDPTDPFFNRFRQWRPVFLEGNVIKHFQAMRDAKNFIMSQSSLSWWAAFLSSNQRAICPSPVDGVWSPNRESQRGNMLVDPDLFHCLPCEVTYRPNFSEYFYQWRSRIISRSWRPYV